jgi:hypothetical protein
LRDKLNERTGVRSVAVTTAIAALQLCDVKCGISFRDQFAPLPKTGPLRIRVFRGVSCCWDERKTMKSSQFSDAQKAFILRQGNDGVPVADICRKAGIRQATYFNWKKKYEGLQPPEMLRCGG